MREYFNPHVDLYFLQQLIYKYDINLGIIQLLSTFYGESVENSYDYLQEFLTVCRIVKEADDELKLIIFPFSLKSDTSN